MCLCVAWHKDEFFFFLIVLTVNERAMLKPPTGHVKFRFTMMGLWDTNN